MDKIMAIREEMTRSGLEKEGILCSCDCGKPKFPNTSKRQVKPISKNQTRNTVFFEKKTDIVDILNKINKPVRIMEIGVMAGDFAEVLLNNLTIEKMVLIDPFDNNDSMSIDGIKRFDRETNLQYVQNRFQGNPNVEILQGYSGDVIPKNFLGMNPNEYFDFIYIDSDHEFLNTYNEILYASQILKPKGIIGIDDYTLSLNDPVFVCETMQATTEFLEVNKDWKVSHYSFNDAGIPNIYLSRYFEDEHPQ